MVTLGRLAINLRWKQKNIEKVRCRERQLYYLKKMDTEKWFWKQLSKW
jgi:hypothetical protein